MVSISKLIKDITAWASCHNELEEIILIGSQSRRDFNEEIGANSDIDLAMIIQGEDVPDWIYSDLSKIGLKINIMIHPLVLCTNEIEMKKSIINYERALSSGKSIYKKYKDMPNNRLHEDRS